MNKENLLPNRCQHLNIFVWKSHKYWTFLPLLFLSHPIFPVFFEVIFLQFLQKSSSNECRFWSFTSESQRFLCVLCHLLNRIFPRLFCLFSCQFQIIYRTKKEAKDLWSNASFFIFSLTFQENFHSKIRTILENRGRR